MTSLRVRAPAKLNWTLEVLGKRVDGYHGIRSVMQTIGLTDLLSFELADELALRVYGGPSLSRRPPETNLVLQAADLLKKHSGASAGARITLNKQIPIAAGLGGGSTDAAGTLRGLRELWELSVSNEDLTQIGAQLGSDIPFFLRGGTALVSGRGEMIAPLPDLPSLDIIVAWPARRPRPNKTARMYAALRPEHYSDGGRAEALAARLRAGEPIRDENLCNVFEAVLPEVDPGGAADFQRAGALGFGRPHLCGSGPAFFFLLGEEQPAEPLVRALREHGLTAVEAPTLSAAESIISQELP